MDSSDGVLRGGQFGARWNHVGLVLKLALLVGELEVDLLLAVGEVLGLLLDRDTLHHLDKGLASGVVGRGRVERRGGDVHGDCDRRVCVGVAYFDGFGKVEVIHYLNFLI